MAAPTSPYANAISARADLVGWWPLNETSGTTAHDYSGNASNGTYNSNVSIGIGSSMPGCTETCFYLDGSGSLGRISLSATGTGFNSMTAYSFIAWVYPTSINGLGYFVYKSGQWQMSMPNTAAYVQLQSQFTVGGATKQSTSSAGTVILNASNTWYADAHMLVTTYDGSRFKTYINGYLMSNVAATGTVHANTGNGLYFGTPSGVNAVAGYYQHLSLHNAALTQAAIQDLYVLGNQGTYPVALQKRSYVYAWSTNVVAANGSRKRITLTNDDDMIIWLSLGSTASASQGLMLLPNGGQVIIEDYTGVISAVLDQPIGYKNLCILEE